MNNEAYKFFYGISDEVLNMAQLAENSLHSVFSQIDYIKEYNQLKVISAMQKNRLSDIHFAGTTGYGYDDIGRDVIDRIYADVFECEAAFVRHSISTGTQAISTALFGILRPGDEILSITGTPYDTLYEVIGIRKRSGSLADFNISYRQVDLLEDGSFDYEEIKNSIQKNTKVVFIQRSPGYMWRKSISTDQIINISDYVKSLSKKAVIFVDNCYGEFTDMWEPSSKGADIIAGSLIKNPGGGISPSGGYIAGKEECIENSAHRHTAPGLGRKVGPSLGQNRLILQGLLLSPHVVSESLKGAAFCSAVMNLAGFETMPNSRDKRYDITQAVKFNKPEFLRAFCEGIQSGSVVDSHVTPEPWDMPGYDCPVIMAAGGFIQGSSIELSADGPMKHPYIGYLQGGMVYECTKTGVLCALEKMYKLDRNLVHRSL